MTYQQTSEMVTLVTSERTFRLEIEMPLGGDPFISGHREVVKSVGDTVIAREVVEPARRFLSKVEQAAKVKQAIEILSELVDVWRAEDVKTKEERDKTIAAMPIRPHANTRKPP